MVPKREFKLGGRRRPTPAVSNSEQGTSGTRGGLTRLGQEMESASLRSENKITNVWTEIGLNHLF